MFNKKVIEMDYPLTSENPLFDGKTHQIKPSKLLRFEKEGRIFYILQYKDETLNKNMTTLLEEIEGQFYKLPLNIYDNFGSWLLKSKIYAKSVSVETLPDHILTVTPRKLEEFLAERPADVMNKPFYNDSEVEIMNKPLLESNYITLDYPLDESNPLYDGTSHQVRPVELFRFERDGRIFYIFSYYDETLEQIMITLLEEINGVFYKLPLINYNDDFNRLCEEVMTGTNTRASIDVLPPRIFTKNPISFGDVFTPPVPPMPPLVTPPVPPMPPLEEEIKQELTVYYDVLNEENTYYLSFEDFVRIFESQDPKSREEEKMLNEKITKLYRITKEEFDELSSKYAINLVRVTPVIREEIVDEKLNITPDVLYDERLHMYFVRHIIAENYKLSGQLFSIEFNDRHVENEFDGGLFKMIDPLVLESSSLLADFERKGLAPREVMVTNINGQKLEQENSKRKTK